MVFVLPEPLMVEDEAGVAVGVDRSLCYGYNGLSLGIAGNELALRWAGAGRGRGEQGEVPQHVEHHGRAEQLRNVPLHRSEPR